MRTTSWIMTALGAAALLGACEADEVLRNVELAAVVSVPEGHVHLVGDHVGVEFGAVEDLADGTRFVVWADTAGAPVALAEAAAPGEVEVDLADAGLALEDVEALLVSEEPAGTGLPTGEPTTVYLSGELGGGLTFGGIESGDYEGIMGTAELHDDELHVMAMGLPELPDGFRYGVWLMFMPAHDGDGEMEMMPMGGLDDTGVLMGTGQRMLGGAATVTVTVESANGTDMMSTSTVLRGEVKFVNGDGAEPSEGGGGGGGHMH